MTSHERPAIRRSSSLLERLPGEGPPLRPSPAVVLPAVPRVLRAGDLPPDVLRTRVRDGSLMRVLRGVYAEVSPDGLPWDLARSRVLARAAALHAVRTGDHWFSHRTAALLHGYQLVAVPDDVDVTALSAPRASRTGGVRGVREHWTSRATRAAEVDRTASLPVSPIERTAVDCAATLDRAHGLVVADSALRAGADPAVIDQMLAAAAGDRGVRRAREVLAFADARSESPGESLLRWHVRAAGLPAPDLQVAVPTRLGWRWVDLGWREERVALEFDGRLKYGGSAQESSAAVDQEKRRQDALEDAGWIVVRFTWADLRHPEEVGPRVGRALRSAHSRRR